MESSKVDTASLVLLPQGDLLPCPQGSDDLGVFENGEYGNWWWPGDWAMTTTSSHCYMTSDRGYRPPVFGCAILFHRG